MIGQTDYAAGPSAAISSTRTRDPLLDDGEDLLDGPAGRLDARSQGRLDLADRGRQVVGVVSQCGSAGRSVCSVAAAEVTRLLWSGLLTEWTIARRPAFGQESLLECPGDRRQAVAGAPPRADRRTRAACSDGRAAADARRTRRPHRASPSRRSGRACDDWRRPGSSSTPASAPRVAAGRGRTTPWPATSAARLVASIAPEGIVAEIVDARGQVIGRVERAGRPPGAARAGRFGVGRCLPPRAGGRHLADPARGGERRRPGRPRHRPAGAPARLSLPARRAVADRACSPTWSTARSSSTTT